MGSSMAKLSMHNNRRRETAAYAKYQAGMKEYKAQLEEYQEDPDYYATKMSQYCSSLVAKEINNQ